MFNIFIEVHRAEDYVRQLICGLCQLNNYFFVDQDIHILRFDQRFMS